MTAFFTIQCTVSDLHVNSEYMGHTTSSERFLILTILQMTIGPAFVQQLYRTNNSDYKIYLYISTEKNPFLYYIIIVTSRTAGNEPTFS
jgi:hypothetical protein